MKKACLLVGNFLSAFTGIRGVGEELAQQLEAAGWKVITTSDKPGRLQRLLDMIITTWSKRSEYGVAYVEVYSDLAFLWAEVICRILRVAGKPYILTLHGGGLPEFAGRWPRRVRRLLTGAAVVTTPSGYLLEKMKNYRRDLRLLPNPLNLRAYKFQLRSRPQPRLVWLRAFHRIYNCVLAPRVIAALAAKVPEINLVMVGPDKGDGSLIHTRRKAAELGVETRIMFPGKVSKQDVPLWLNRGDIFLNTTDVDNTPVSVLEAMACGLCVVSTDVGGIPYLLEDGVDALLVPRDDAAAMAAAVSRILFEPGLGEHLSRLARRKVEQFDWDIILPQWEELLTTLAQEMEPGITLA